jgi:hypothetical protein
VVVAPDGGLLRECARVARKGNERGKVVGDGALGVPPPSPRRVPVPKLVGRHAEDGEREMVKLGHSVSFRNRIAMSRYGTWVPHPSPIRLSTSASESCVVLAACAIPLVKEHRIRALLDRGARLV